jgi:hypothetical protein
MYLGVDEKLSLGLQQVEQRVFRQGRIQEAKLELEQQLVHH